MPASAAAGVDHARQRLRPHEILRDFDWGTRAGSPAAASCASGSSTPSTRRSRSLPASLSPPGPTTAASPGRRCAAARASACGSASQRLASTRTRSTSTASTRRRWTASRAGAGPIEPAARPCTSSTRFRPGCTSTTVTCGRWPRTSPRACTAPSSSIEAAGRPRRRRDGDGDERVRHQLRSRERVLRGQHDPVRVHEHRRSGPSWASWCASTWSTSSSTTSSTRSTCTGTCSIRVPACSESAGDAARLWINFLLTELEADPSILAIVPTGAGWIDLVVGEPTHAADLAASDRHLTGCR